MTRTFTLMLFLAWRCAAQGELTLRDAVLRALEHNRSIDGSSAEMKASESRIVEARAGQLPKINYTESWAVSDNPVFVFSSLLTQHQFGTENFQLGPLNRPGFLNDFQTRVSADQPLYDAGRAKHAIRAAELRRNIAGEEVRRTRMDVIAAVIRAWYDAVLAGTQLGVANEALRSAEADLARAESIRSAGMSTDADVLSIRVHLARVREQRIRYAADLDVAQAALDDAMGLPLETLHTLPHSISQPELPDIPLAEYEKRAVSERPEARESAIASSISDNEVASARANLLPHLSLHAALEVDRQRFYDRGGANAIVSVEMRWNLFNGFSDKARIEETRQDLLRTQASRDRALSAIRLQVRRAHADMQAAKQRIEVARAAIAEAEESLRITQNRYQAGLNDVTNLLRTETALLESRSRLVEAVRDQRVAAAMLEYSTGTLGPDSEVLK